MATTYLAHLELRADALPADYEVAHALMKSCGFERWIIGAASDQPFLLPANLYAGSAMLTRQEAFEMLRKALTEAFPTSVYGLILAEAEGIVFEGLSAVV